MSKERGWSHIDCRTFRRPVDRGVLIVEGEKDADRAANIGIVATTCAMGAGKWRPEYNEHFRGRSVYIVPDNDDPGREHAQQVAQALHGIAKGIKVVELPGVPEKGDLSDWLDQGGTKAELAELVKASPSGSRPPPASSPSRRRSPRSPSPRPTSHFRQTYCPKWWPTSSTRARRPLAAMSPTSLCRCWLHARLPWVIRGEFASSGLVRAVHPLDDHRGRLRHPKIPGPGPGTEPIRKVQNAAFGEHKKAMEQYQADKATFEADLAEWKKKGPQETANLCPRSPRSR